MDSNTPKGNGAKQNQPRLDEILLVSLQELAAAGRVETACRLAGQACAALRQSDPVGWRGFNALLHRLTRYGDKAAHSAAERVELAVSHVMNDNKYLTPDLGGSAGTDGVAAAVIAALGRG